MMNRRYFLHALPLTAIAVSCSPGQLNNESSSDESQSSSPENESKLQKLAMGVQLYTLRHQLDKDVKSVLEKVKSLGISKIELYGYEDGKQYGIAPKEFKKMVDDLGLEMLSGHYSLGKTKTFSGTIRKDWNRAIDDAAEMELDYMVLGWLSPEERESLDDYKSYIEEFVRASEMAKKAGMQFAYHNHEFEFFDFDGTMPYDYMLEQTDSETLKMEMDFYWVEFAGKDPLAYFEKYPGRFPLWHVKDMDNTEKRFFTEVGNGIIDFPRIFAQAERAGLKHYFIEQDECPGSPYDSLQMSVDNIKKMKI